MSLGKAPSPERAAATPLPSSGARRGCEQQTGCRRYAHAENQPERGEPEPYTVSSAAEPRGDEAGGRAARWSRDVRTVWEIRQRPRGTHPQIRWRHCSRARRALPTASAARAPARLCPLRRASHHSAGANAASRTPRVERDVDPATSAAPSR